MCDTPNELQDPTHLLYTPPFLWPATTALGEADAAAEAASQNASIAQSTAEWNAAATVAVGEYNASVALAYSQYQAAAITANAQYQANIAATNAAIAHNNAITAENQALAQREQAKYNAEKIRQRNRRLLGQQTAGYAKAGVDLAGSPEDVIYDSAVQGELEALMAIYAGDISAHAYFAEATAQKYAGSVFEYQSRVLLEVGSAEAANVLSVGQAQADLIMYEANVNAQGILMEGANQANVFETQADMYQSSGYFNAASNMMQMGAQAGQLYLMAV
jgi:hypothetical protein